MKCRNFYTLKQIADKEKTLFSLKMTYNNNDVQKTVIFLFIDIFLDMRKDSHALSHNFIFPLHFSNFSDQILF